MIPRPMTDRTVPADPAAAKAGSPLSLDPAAQLPTTYLLEGILSFAANLLFIGVFFYTKNVFHWDLVRNFLLAAGQGAVYVVASLSSQGLAKVLGPRRLLISCNLALAAVALLGVLV